MHNECLRRANDENATRIRLHVVLLTPFRERAPSNHVGLETLAPKHMNDHPEGHVEIAREQTDNVFQDEFACTSTKTC